MHATNESTGGAHNGKNGSDEAQHRREAILAIVDDLRQIRDRANELGLGLVTRAIDAAIIATARRVDAEMLPTEDEEPDD